MTPIVGKIYRQKVDSQQGYEYWEYTGITKEAPDNELWYAFKNDLGVYYFDKNDLKEFKEALNMVQITKKDFNNLRKELGLAFVGLGEYSATLEDPDVCQKHLSKMYEILKKYSDEK